MINPQQALQLAVTHSQAGRLEEADAVCRQIIAIYPNYAPALYQLGLVSLVRGRLEDARQWMMRAVALAPMEAAYYADLGVTNWALRRGEEAVACFQRALALQPGLAHVHSNLGDTLKGMGRVEEAIASYQRALAVRPNYAEAYNNLAVALNERGDTAAAISHLRQALAIKPDFIEALCNLGDAHSKRGETGEALAALTRALVLRPHMAEAHYLLGTALWRAGQWKGAEASLRRAIELKPDLADAHHNLGSALLQMDRLDEAIATYRRALAINPASANAHSNLGVAFQRKGLFDLALAAFRESVARQPDFAEAHYNLALLLLLLGHFGEGWREHEWRWRTPVPVSPVRPFPVPAWDGRPMTGQTLLLHAEQGFGDTIQFIRYVPLVIARSQASRVLVECPGSLARLLAQVPGIEVIPRQGWSLGGFPPFDRHLPLMSLPLVLGENEPLRVERPYLQADDALRVKWRSRLDRGAKLRVGIAWAGNREHKEDARRSIPFEKVGPLLATPQVSFVTLQFEKPPTLEARLIDFTEELTDFAESAALIAELDVVISVDTAAVHLAGALGKPVWLLVAAVPDWRWGIAGETTPWYSSMRVFRQPTPGNWPVVIEQVMQELTALATR